MCLCVFVIVVAFKVFRAVRASPLSPFIDLALPVCPLLQRYDNTHISIIRSLPCILVSKFHTALLSFPPLWPALGAEGLGQGVRQRVEQGLGKRLGTNCGPKVFLSKSSVPAHVLGSGPRGPSRKRAVETRPQWYRRTVLQNS